MHVVKRQSFTLAAHIPYNKESRIIPRVNPVMVGVNQN